MPGGGRVAAELLTSWIQHPNVPHVQQGAEAFYWERDVSMAPAHLQPHISSVNTTVEVLSLHLLPQEEPPPEVPGQEGRLEILAEELGWGDSELANK